MKIWKLLVVFITLLTAAATAQATSCDTHKKAAPAPGTAQAEAHDHDHDHSKDSASHEDDDSSSHEDSEDESELHEQMERIGKNFKKLNRLFRGENPDLNQALKHVTLCKKGAKAAKDLVPELVEEMEEGTEKEEALKQYQEKAGKLHQTFTELEAVLKEGDTAKAKGMLTLLKKQKKEGHKQFIKEDEDDDDHG